ncbi:hypothetical protein E4U14_002325 [Claviceps sp. LM454 group G7]|nr:hypothetical protein E4U14_002325 [Claviceps sp. LM454 group G7]
MLTGPRLINIIRFGQLRTTTGSLTDTYKLVYINTASNKSDTSMHDAPTFLHQATHHSIAEEDPDITIPDAPSLPNQLEQQYTGMASITMIKFLASPVHYSYQPTVQEFAPASEEYLFQAGFPHAPRVFPQQNNVNSVLLKEELRAST